MELELKIIYNQNMATSKRTNSGRIPQKRSDTLVGNIEKQYNVDFGVRSDKKLGQFLKDNGLPSLSKALEKVSDPKSRKK